jgi:hypothetical protein
LRTTNVVEGIAFNLLLFTADGASRIRRHFVKSVGKSCLDTRTSANPFSSFIVVNDVLTGF